MQVMNDCKTCQHATVLFQREKEDRFSTAYSPTGFVRCKRARYKGRAYFCRDSRNNCGDYDKRDRGAAQ